MIFGFFFPFFAMLAMLACWVFCSVMSPAQFIIAHWIGMVAVLLFTGIVRFGMLAGKIRGAAGPVGPGLNGGAGGVGLVGVCPGGVVFSSAGVKSAFISTLKPLMSA